MGPPAERSPEEYKQKNEEYFRACLGSKSGCWYEDTFLQIGLKREVNHATKSIAYELYFGNKHPDRRLDITKLAATVHDTKGSFCPDDL